VPNPSTNWAEQTPGAASFAKQSAATTAREAWTLQNELTGRVHEIARLNKNTIASKDETGYGYTIAELNGAGPTLTRTP
jgi:hypothetical protein